jgi:uncharacterized protein (DUF885 family)
MLFLLPLGMALAASGREPATATADSLASVCHEYWEGSLRASPTWATSLGDRRYDHLLEEITPEARELERQRLDGLLERARSLDPKSLNRADRVNRAALLEVIENDLAGMSCDFHLWTVDPMGGPQTNFFNLPSIQPVKTPEQGQAMVQRWRAMGPYLDGHIANLRAGAGAGLVATHDQVRRVIDQLDELLARPVEGWSLLDPLAEKHEDWPAAEREAFDAKLRAAVTEEVRPALSRYREFLKSEIFPRARPAERVGLAHLPGGAECYRKMIRVHTSLDLPAEEIHRLGLDEVTRIRNEMSALAAKELGTAELPEILRRLRTDKQLYFATREEVEAKAREALARAQGAVPRWFGIQPQAKCEVVPMEEHEEKHSTIAYYRQPALDGSRPGRYYINTYAPDTRPRYEAEALAFHEAVPGHHLQIAIAQELKDLPEFRKHTGVTAYVEGWALYTEELAEEMGLYSSDLDRIGKLSFEAWRASRLVVDTGMHALGWSRQQAIDFMLANTALAENNIVNEVDRYITWPGQALAYKLGQLEILKLREEARGRLGKRFDMRAFHDCVLRNGAVGLGALRELVEECTPGS